MIIYSKTLDSFCKDISITISVAIGIAMFTSLYVQQGTIRYNSIYVITTSDKMKVKTNKCVRLGDFVYISDERQTIIPISQIIKIEPYDEKKSLSLK